MSAVYPYVAESGDVQSEEPRAVCSCDRAFAVIEIMGNVFGVQDFVYCESSFGSLVVSAEFLYPVIDCSGYPVDFFYVLVFVVEDEEQILLVYEYESCGINPLEQFP